MDITRRRFLSAIGAGAVWSSLPRTGLGLLGAGSPAWAARASRTALDLVTATADTFRPHVGSRFRLQRAGQKALDLRLDGVTSSQPDGVTDAFSLQFSAGGPTGLGQATYDLDHAVLGPFRIFLVPAGSQGLGAVVNHVLK